jgi:hypothetical protein
MTDVVLIIGIVCGLAYLYIIPGVAYGLSVLIYISWSAKKSPMAYIHRNRKLFYLMVPFISICWGPIILGITAVVVIFGFLTPAIMIIPLAYYSYKKLKSNKINIKLHDIEVFKPATVHTMI